MFFCNSEPSLNSEVHKTNLNITDFMPQSQTEHLKIYPVEENEVVEIARLWKMWERILMKSRCFFYKGILIVDYP